ncbi:MAG: hypothetical protein ISS36_01555 [Candidatus Aenigmarchaeota archaeon]|nr:hypothetical protein [Candidatus Aenigmarchaeota archaeon]
MTDEKIEKSKFINPDKLVVDDLFKSPPGAKGDMFFIRPKEMNMILDFTALRGGGSNIYYSLIYQLPKWDFTVKKIDEYIEVTPTWAEYYNITIAQKQKLEQAIKTGLTSATQAVADFELLNHDARRYKEMLDYFKAAKKDEHILRSLFLDRVDVHTGEGYSLVTMARRWPTIITDFIRMKEELTERDDIRKELDVSMAEATVLKTKNDLFKEWKALFFPTVKERYARIQTLVEARKRSVDEYKNWLKPYIAKFKMIREKAEAKPTEILQNPYVTPGFGQSQADMGVRLWAYKCYGPAERGKPESIVYGKDGWLVNPYDDFAHEWKEKIEKYYDIEISDEEVEKIMKTSVGGKPLDPHRFYYMLFDIKFMLSLVRTPPPEGFESDNAMIMPITAYEMSQNVMLVFLIELYAREKVFTKYINEIIGSSEREEEIEKEVEKMFEDEEPEKHADLKKAGEKIKSGGSKVNSGMSKFFHIFVKKGPYENTVKERVSKMHNPVTGANYKTITQFLMDKMQVD